MICPGTLPFDNKPKQYFHRILVSSQQCSLSRRNYEAQLSCCSIGVYLVLINTVSLQVTVKGVIGSSVLLPCFSNNNLQESDVHWRLSNDCIVHSVIKGKDSVLGQAPRYKNRVKTFPKEYKKGNFSIKLYNLQHTDAGKYICYITSSSELSAVLLLINESTAEKGNKFTEQESQEDTGADSVENPSPVLHRTRYAAISAFVLIIIACFIMFLLRKRIQAVSFSSVMTEKQATVI